MAKKPIKSDTPEIVVVDTVSAEDVIVREEAAAAERKQVADDKLASDQATAEAKEASDKQVAEEKAAADAADQADREQVASDLRDAADIARKEKVQERRYDFYKVVILAIIVALPSIIAAVGSAIAVIRMDSLSHAVNGMKTELVEEVRKASKAEGILEGKAGKNGNKLPPLFPPEEPE